MQMTIPLSVGLLLKVTGARMKQMARRFDSHLASFDITDARSPEVYQRLVELLNEHGCLAFQSCVLSDAPWQILWSHNRQSFLPFQERGITLVAFCDPVGPQQERDAVVRLFFAFARAKSKYAVFVLVTESVCKVALDYGCTGIWLGTEIFFDLAQYSLDGKSGRRLRQDISHIQRLSGTAREMYPLENDVDRQAMREVELSWKNARSERNKDSFLGTKPMENAHFRRYFTVETPNTDGPKMQSFQVCSPVSQRGWFLHDLVRRPDAPRGAAELAASSALDAFHTEGIEFVTMGLVPFNDPTGQPTPSKTSPLMRLGIDYFDRLYHFSGMQLFRSKFSPTRTENAYFLFWPPIFTPFIIWDICAVL